MITQSQLPAIIADYFPQFSTLPCPTADPRRAHTLLHAFTDHTRQAVGRHDIIEAKKCFRFAALLHRKGDRMVQCLIENIFVYSFTSILPSEKVERLIIKSLIPDRLFDAYVSQIMGDG